MTERKGAMLRAKSAATELLDDLADLLTDERAGKPLDMALYMCANQRVQELMRQFERMRQP